jgi:hypothetical protein
MIINTAPVSLPAWSAVVDPVIAYAEWRTSCMAVWAAYRKWSNAAVGDGQLAHAAYVAALDREDAAAHAYSGLVTPHSLGWGSSRSG